MQTRHQIAILVAGLLVGAQIGVAAIDTPIPEAAEYMEPVPGEAQALEPGTAGEPTEAASEPSTVADANAPTSITETEQPILPVAARHSELPSVFPASTDDIPMLPALAAYLDRTEHLRLTGAPAAFPPSGDEVPMLPRVAAYLDQRDAARLAALNPAPAASGVAAVSPTNGNGGSPTTAAPAGAQVSEREVAALDTRSSLSAGTPY
jgi:hypothetical protein